MSTDYSGDYRFWDNVEALTVTIKRPDPLAPGSPTSTDIPIAIAFREDLDRKTAAILEVQSTEDVQVWNVPAALMTTNELRENDEITDTDNVIWTIISATLVRIGTCKLHWLAAVVKQR